VGRARPTLTVKASTSTRTERQPQQCAITATGEPVASAGRQQLVENAPVDGAPALAPPRAGVGTNGEAQGRAQRRAANGPSMLRQRCSVFQLASRRLTVAGACGPSARRRPLSRSASATASGMPMGRIVLTLGGVPEMMGDKFEREALGRRPGLGRAGRRLGPSLEIGQIRG
jgi:hypothetical protein